MMHTDICLYLQVVGRQPNNANYNKEATALSSLDEPILYVPETLLSERNLECHLLV
jgi:hypothetical protein